MNKVSFGAWGATIIWVGIVGWVTFAKRAEFAGMPPNAIGDFLAGTVSPLALIWLVAGYLQQGKELRLNTEALRAQLTELSLYVASTAIIADSTKEQAAVAREAFNFEQQKSELAELARLGAHKRAIRPNIVAQIRYIRNGQFSIEIKNSGADAKGIVIQSPQFETISDSKFSLLEKNHVRQLSLSRRAACGSGVPFLEVVCLDQDSNKHVFIFDFDEDSHKITRREK